MAKVLVVDDNPDACSLLARLIALLGYQSLSLTSGEEALEYLRSSPADLVILDLMMPGLDGMQVLRCIRANVKLKELPVVMFSAYGDPQYVEHARREGANDYWIKASVDFDQLDKLIGRWVKDDPSACA